eukprot:9524027-Heterocapsa_arctica.AAC.1
MEVREHEKSSATKAGKDEEERTATQAEKAEENLLFKSMEVRDHENAPGLHCDKGTEGTDPVENTQ